MLGGLVEGLQLREILALFQDAARRKAVFSPTKSFVDRALRELAGMGPKYSAEGKLPALQNALPTTGTLPLNRAAAGVRRPGSSEDVHLLIVAFDYDRDRATFFRSSPASGPAMGTGEVKDITLAEVIHASTNAPVNYFDMPASFPDRPGHYWDGAISGCNNPVLAAVTEAIVKGQDATNLAVLSIGTATLALPWPQEAQQPSPYFQPIVAPQFAGDLHKLATSIVDEPPDIATFLAHVMTGSGVGLNRPPADSRIVRMNPLISPVMRSGVWSGPGAMTAAQFKFLVNIDMDAVEQPEVDSITAYANLWLQGAAANQPVRMDGDTLALEIGQDTYPKAVAAWNAIK